MNIVIKKAGIRNSIFLSYEFEQKDADVNNTIKTSSDAPIHDDLRAAFRALIPHFAFVCEEITNEDLVRAAIERPESYLEDREHSVSLDFFKFYVNEFSIVDKKGMYFLTISGNKQLTDGDIVSFSAPAIDLEGSSYMFIRQLNEAVDVLKNEVLAYMQGKQAPKAQLQMFDDEEADSEEAFGDAPKPKAKTSKKTKAVVEAEE
jgi:hypothetical protein